jgi:hypothetical protein
LAAILYYDYLLTFSVEFECFWTPRWRTWGSILFFFNRYLTLLGHIPVIYEFFFWAESDSNALWKINVSSRCLLPYTILMNNDVSRGRCTSLDS